VTCSKPEGQMLVTRSTNVVDKKDQPLATRRAPDR
jgi:hypothetical protein